MNIRGRKKFFNSCLLHFKKASLTIWQDKNDVGHFFRQIDENTWEEVFNGTKYYTFKLVFSALSQTINLFERDYNFYVQLKCSQCTYGLKLSTITDNSLYSGYWTDNSGIDLCS